MATATVLTIGYNGRQAGALLAAQGTTAVVDIRRWMNRSCVQRVSSRA